MDAAFFERRIVSCGNLSPLLRTMLSHLVGAASCCRKTGSTFAHDAML